MNAPGSVVRAGVPALPIFPGVLAILIHARLFEPRQAAAHKVADELETRLAERAAAPARNRSWVGRGSG